MRGRSPGEGRGLAAIALVANRMFAVYRFADRDPPPPPGRRPVGMAPQFQRERTGLRGRFPPGHPQGRRRPSRPSAHLLLSNAAPRRRRSGGAVTGLLTLTPPPRKYE